jgi:hypothetical protein
VVFFNLEPLEECCLVWLQLAFAAGFMLLFAFPYIHIGLPFQKKEGCEQNEAAIAGY